MLNAAGGTTSLTIESIAQGANMLPDSAAGVVSGAPERIECQIGTTPLMGTTPLTMDSGLVGTTSLMERLTTLEDAGTKFSLSDVAQEYLQDVGCQQLSKADADSMKVPILGPVMLRGK